MEGYKAAQEFLSKHVIREKRLFSSARICQGIKFNLDVSNPAISSDTFDLRLIFWTHSLKTRSEASSPSMRKLGSPLCFIEPEKHLKASICIEKLQKIAEPLISARIAWASYLSNPHGLTKIH